MICLAAASRLGLVAALYVGASLCLLQASEHADAPSQHQASSTVTKAIAEDEPHGVPGTNHAGAPAPAQAAEQSWGNLPETLVTTNLMPLKEDPQMRAKLESLHAQVESARRMRRIGDFRQAEQVLKGVLQQAAPREIHRAAMLEMALTAQDAKHLTRAQQVYSQYVQAFREDPSVPEILLRQGLLYREMGAPVLALSKFYAVMSSALTVKPDSSAYFERMVLQAQTEIADTYYLDGKFGEAADFFSRLLKLDTPHLNRELVHYKFVRSYSAAGRPAQALAQAQLFSQYYPESEYLAEVKFMLADALKQLGRTGEAMQEVIALLKAQRAVADKNHETWLYWQQRTGNLIANQLFEEGDLAGALEIYLRLAGVNSAPDWRLSAWYQAGLIYERLKQPQKAAELYQRILKEDLSGGNPSESLKLVLDMARWRSTRLDWQAKAEVANQNLTRPASQSPAPAAP
jgi:tetratricopeptide (TPR) repeat protein